MKLKKINCKVNILPRIKLRFSKSSLTKVVNSVLRENLRYLSLKVIDNNEVEIEIYSAYIKKYRAMLNSINVEYTEGLEYGLFSIFRKNKYRVGILFGMAFMVILCFLSTKIVWKINISGNEKYSDEEILEIIENAGLKLGTFIPSINYDALHNKVLLSTDKISWISVNIKGTVANIEVKEAIIPVPQKEKLYANIVSKSDGQIISIMTINGETKIKVGDVVKEGEILISGVIDSQSSGARYVCAKGNVYAYVNKKVVVKIPQKSSETKLTKLLHTDKSIKIFANNIKFSTKHSNCGEFCVKIEKKKSLRLFGAIELPLAFVFSEHYAQETIDVYYSKQEMVDIAFSKLNAELDMISLDAEIVSKNINSYFDGESFIVECNLYCIENIAKEVEFFVE